MTMSQTAAARGAANAVEAGFDGVEVHAANGYLPHQFLSATLNRPDDRYGGSLDKRLRFLREVVDAVVAEAGAHRVGVRLSPFAAYNDTRDPNPAQTHAVVASMLDGCGLAYLHLADTNALDGQPALPRILDIVRPRFRGVLIGNGGIAPQAAASLVADGALDLVAFGRHFLANPDLPERIRHRGPYNTPRSVGWYGGGAEGYADYPKPGPPLRPERSRRAGGTPSLPTPEHRHAACYPHRPQAEVGCLQDHVLDAVHAALVSSGAPKADLFQRVIELNAEDFRFDPVYPDLKMPRNDDFVLIEILWSIGRSVKAKRALLEHLMGDLVRAGFEAENVMVCFKDTTWESWSFGGARLIHA